MSPIFTTPSGYILQKQKTGKSNEKIGLTKGMTNLQDGYYSKAMLHHIRNGGVKDMKLVFRYSISPLS